VRAGLSGSTTLPHDCPGRLTRPCICQHVPSVAPLPIGRFAA
jgi:hypothetical protein